MLASTWLPALLFGVLLSSGQAAMVAYVPDVYVCDVVAARSIAYVWTRAVVVFIFPLIVLAFAYARWGGCSVGVSGCGCGCVRVWVGQGVSMGASGRCVCVCVWRVGGISVSGSGYGGYWCVRVLVQDVGVGVWV